MTKLFHFIYAHPSQVGVLIPLTEATTKSSDASTEATEATAEAIKKHILIPLTQTTKQAVEASSDATTWTVENIKNFVLIPLSQGTEKSVKLSTDATTFTAENIHKHLIIPATNLTQNVYKVVVNGAEYLLLTVMNGSDHSSIASNESCMFHGNFSSQSLFESILGKEGFEALVTRLEEGNREKEQAIEDARRRIEERKARRGQLVGKQKSL